MRWGAALSSQSCSRCCVWLGCRVERPACSPSCTASDHTGWVALLLQLQQQRDEPLQLQRGVNAAGSFAVRAITASDCARLCMLLIEGRPEPQRTRRQPVRPPSCQGHPCLVRLGLTDQQQPHLAPSLTSVPVQAATGRLPLQVAVARSRSRRTGKSPAESPVAVAAAARPLQVVLPLAVEQCQ